MFIHIFIHKLADPQFKTKLHIIQNHNIISLIVLQIIIKYVKLKMLCVYKTI